MSTIEAITLEYSYLLSSQLEAMRQHYESQQSDLQQRLDRLEGRVSDIDHNKSALEAAEKEKRKAENKAKQAVELSRNLQSSLAAERAMTQGLSKRIKALETGKEQREREKRELEEEKQGLEDTVRDLMFSLEAGTKIQQMGGEAGEGGDLVVKPTEKSTKGKKKGR
jgi:BRCA1-associated protein